MTKEEALALYHSGRLRTVSILMAQAMAVRSQARRIQALQAENIKLKAQLALAKHNPDTPSGMKPVYAKPPPAKRGRKPGAKMGHLGHSRPIPAVIDQAVEHKLSCCPKCRGVLSAPVASRSRLIEDIPVVKPLVSEHIIHRYWCRMCRKIVEPTVTQAYPRCTLGNNLLVFSSWLHYGLGLTIDKVVHLLNTSCHFKVTAGGLLQAWQRLAGSLDCDYKQIKQMAKTSPVLHADETGWRLSGRTHWLWCFTNQQLAYYKIERSRGSPVVRKVLGTKFNGTLVTDFYAAYNAVEAPSRQRCLVHLDREIEKIDLADHSLSWMRFRKKLRRWIRNARTLGRIRNEISNDCFQRRRRFLEDRLTLLGYISNLRTKHARRLAERLQRFEYELLTFLNVEGVSSNNNHAERQIRPAVVIRKNSYGNRSRRGADTQEALMSIFQTLHLRSLNPMKTLHEGCVGQLSTGRQPLAAALAQTSFG